MLQIHEKHLDYTKGQIECIYPGCPDTIFQKTKMFEHIEKVHDAKVEVDLLNFASMGDFLFW